MDVETFILPLIASLDPSAASEGVLRLLCELFAPCFLGARVSKKSTSQHVANLKPNVVSPRSWNVQNRVQSTIRNPNPVWSPWSLCYPGEGPAWDLEYPAVAETVYASESLALEVAKSTSIEMGQSRDPLRLRVSRMAKLMRTFPELMLIVKVVSVSAES